MFDTHAHVNFRDYKDDYEEVIKRSLENNTRMINVGSQFSTSRRAVDLAEKYEGLYAAIGLHPIHLSDRIFQDKVEEEEVKFIPRAERFIKEKYFDLVESKKVVAVGEIGLDYFHNQDNKDEQKKAFQDQIDFAMELDLPIIIHCREAHDDIIEILNENKKRYGEKLRGVVHCFSGRLSQAQIYIEMGFYIGFNGIITFARDYDKVINGIGMENILLETDCPYLTPTPFRGKRNEPLYVMYVAEKIAELKNIPLSEVEKITDENAEKLFGV